MKDLKENIKKNNMKKLVLSVVLGMFCYCTNNAMITSINDVLLTMLKGQEAILLANVAINKHKKNIYSTIINEERKIKKEQLSNFIIQHIDKKLPTSKIKKLGQYFHLYEIKKKGECTEKNLTEIFWVAEEGGKQIKEPVKEIREYFDTIIKAEEARSIAFIKYYEIKKEKNKEKKEDVILGEIMNECCGEEEGKDIHQKFLANLKKLYKINPDNKNEILESIKRRITLNDEITEENFISFLKQKIGLQNKKCTKPEEEKKEDEKEEEKKEDEKEEEKSQIGVNDHLKPKGGCPCCDC